MTGTCPACQVRSAEKNRPSAGAVAWEERLDQLRSILQSAPLNDDGYNCIVPSSGGKDSTYQVLTLIELGARPLVVTATTCHLTPIGRRNIDNLARYATTVEVSPNKRVRALLNRIGLETVGDISWPEHVSIFTTPFRIAAQTKIPLIFYGENPQREYSGPPGSEQAMELTRRWRSEFGGFLGLRPDDCVGMHGITDHDMDDYRLPEENHTENIRAFFLGQFIPWDSHRNARIAKDAGMEQAKPHAGAWWVHENLDNAQTGIHDYQAYLKYGYTRSDVQLSVDVRTGRLTRPDAVAISKTLPRTLPEVYAGVPLGDVLDRLELSRKDFNSHLERFTAKNS